jgi:hypothetical protein
MSSARPVPNSTDFFFPWFTNALRGYAGNIAVTVDALFSALLLRRSTLGSATRCAPFSWRLKRD